MRNRLSPGDTIGLVAIARWVEQETIDQAVQLFTSWGLQVVIGKSLHARYHQFAGTDAERAADLQHMLDAPDIHAICVMRGGYGTIRIMEYLDFTAFTNKPKYICGFSDVTVLHAHINDKLGLPTLHCTMPFAFSHNTPQAIDTMHKALFHAPDCMTADHHPLNKSGNCTAQLIGGNLSILYALLGTRFGFSTAGKILVLEDVDEYLYHIDRMLMSLKLAGKLDHIAGLIVGGMTDMKDNAIPFGETAEEIIQRHLAHLSVPVAFGLPFGHIDDNRAMILGGEVYLSVEPEQTRLCWL